ncbi:hypothetical protein NX059_000678 [Plenodomus lindquistii]|nr:hypothetical protein NX059_000678 [Plenodomus lindquistii]
MPIPVPPGAYPSAHRVFCLRSVRAWSRGKFDFTHSFESAGSKKCAYCTLLNEKCKPVPVYAGPECDQVVAALRDFEGLAARAVPADEDEARELEAELADARAAASSAARTLASVVQVATAQVAGLGATDVMLASYYAQQEELRGLREEVSDLRQEMRLLRKDVVTSVAAPSGEAPGSSGGKRKRGPVRGPNGKFLKRGGAEDSELGEVRDASDSEVEVEGSRR